MPQLGESVTEGTIGRWLKSLGESVAKDEPLVEIITDKVNVEIPSPAAGVLTKISAQEGQTVPVGSEIAELDGDQAAAQPAKKLEPANAAVATASAPPNFREEGQASDGDRPRTSPLVRRLARAHSLDLS